MGAALTTTSREAASLPALVERAAAALAGARTAAEVLDAGEHAAFAYDVAKRAARIAKAKKAHDDLITAVYRAQADALEIEAQAKRRLADEYDAAQERKEVAVAGDNQRGRSGGERPPSAADLGLSRKDIHEARIIRNAERADPGIVKRILQRRCSRTTRRLDQLRQAQKETIGLDRGVASALGMATASTPLLL